MTSEGQAWALAQMREICDEADGALEIIAVEPPAAEGDALEIELSVSCVSFPQKPGGIPFRSRERLRIGVPFLFPFHRPDLHFAHTRYGSHAHVQWGTSVCL